MGSTPSWVAPLATGAGFLLLVPTGVLYLASGLVVPFPWTVAMWAVGLALGAFAVVSRRRPGVVLAVPVVAVVLWVAVVSAGSALLGWTA